MLHSFGEGWSPVLDFSMIIFELEVLVKTGSGSRERSAIDIQEAFYDKMRIKNDSKNLLSSSICFPNIV